MPLSPHEQKVLADLEAELRAEDPTFADALGRTPPAAAPIPFPAAIRHVLRLGALLILLAVVGTFFSDRLGVLGLAALTCAVVVPWLVSTPRSAEHRSSTRRARAEATAKVGGVTTSAGDTRHPAIDRRVRLLGGVVLMFVALAALPPPWTVALGLVLTFAVMPWVALYLVQKFERPNTT